MDESDHTTATFRLSGVFYIDFLNALQTHLTPRSYLEVGTATGASLAVAGRDAIAVDPRFRLEGSATGNRRRTFLFQMTSDDFFATENAAALLGWPVDMAFLGGMHWFEYLLRDFIGAEAACHPRSLILLHDCLPSNTRMALRQFEPGDSSEGDTAGWWTGDVWKLLSILREYRPDLRLHVLDCPPDPPARDHPTGPGIERSCREVRGRPAGGGGQPRPRRLRRHAAGLGQPGSGAVRPRTGRRRSPAVITASVS